LEEGIRIALLADAGFPTVAWDDSRLVGQGEQSVVEGAEDLAAVAAGEVGATDGAGEERVAGEEKILRREVQADAALGVSWGVEDAGGVAGDAGGAAVFGAGVGGNDFGRWDAKPSCLLIHHRKLGQVVLVEQNGSARGLLQARCSADVVDVAVGDDDLLEGEAVFVEKGENLGDIVARVDDHGFAGGLVAENGAVALQRPNRKGFEDHNALTCASACSARCSRRKGPNGDE
jgi:hypothetical protein